MAGSGLFSSSNHQNIGAQMILPFVVTEPRLVEAFNQLLNPGREQTDKQEFRILVNVGWVPRDTMDKVNHSVEAAKNRPVTDNISPSQDFDLIGVIRKTEKRQQFAAKQDVGHGYTGRRDISKISSKLDTTPIFLDAQNSYPIKLNYHSEMVVPAGAQTRVHLRNEHLSYIVTWYSLSGILSYMWYKKIFKPRL